MHSISFSLYKKSETLQRKIIYHKQFFLNQFFFFFCLHIKMLNINISLTFFKCNIALKMLSINLLSHSIHYYSRMVIVIIIFTLLQDFWF